MLKIAFLSLQIWKCSGGGYPQTPLSTALEPRYNEPRYNEPLYNEPLDNEPRYNEPDITNPYITNPDITNPYITKSPVLRTIFFRPVIKECMEKNPNMTNLRYNEHIFPVRCTSLYRGSTVPLFVETTLFVLNFAILISQHFEISRKQTNKKNVSTKFYFHKTFKSSELPTYTIQQFWQN